MLTHFIADDGERIHLAVSGEGSPVVMLHGWTASHQEWFPFLPEFNKRHKVYRWDARGHGGHDLTRPTLPTVQRMARDLKNLLEHYGLEAVTAVGHSMGALTLWEYIRHQGTGHLGRVCLIDQSPKLMTDDGWSLGIYGDFDEAKSRTLMVDLHDDFAEAVLRLGAYGLNSRARHKYEQNARGWRNSRDALKRLNPAPLIATWQSLTEADYRDVLEKIDIPALLVFGDESNFYHLDAARYLASRMPRARLHIYEGTDHSPHQWQRERFAQDLIEFVEAAW